MLRSLHLINGYNVRAVNGDVGRVWGFLFDDTIWAIRYLIVTMPANENTGERNTLIAPFSFGFLNPEKGELPISLEKQKINNSPTTDLEKPISKKHQIELYKYFGWPPFDKYAISNSMQSPMLTKILEEKESEFSNHLINTENTIGYDIEVTDGGIGHVRDFIIDDELWIIRYIEIDIDERIPGKRVLIFPKAIKEINQDKAKLFTDLMRDTVINSPEYDSSVPIGRPYEVKLHQYYGFLRYWD